MSHFSTPSSLLWGGRKVTGNGEALFCLKFPSKGPPAGCSTIASHLTIQKWELRCLHNGEAITTLSVDKSEFKRMCHITDTFSTPSRVSCRKWPFFFKPTAFQLLPRACNVQKCAKKYYGPCKVKVRASGRRFQRFYYEKTLVGWVYCSKGSEESSGVITINMYTY